MKKRAMRESLGGPLDYTMRNGKDARIKANRDRMSEAQHSAADSFVKREQDALKSLGGRPAKLEAKFMEFNAEMVSDGDHAQGFARDLTVGLDKKAFPVK